jgi:hypothetical protein
MKGIDMKKISSVIFLSFVIILLLAGCVKSPSVSVKDEPNVKPPIVEPPNVKTPTSEATIFKTRMVTPRIPDSNVWEHFGKTKSGDNYYNKTNITKSSNIISVSTNKIITDNFRKQTIEEVKKYDLEKSIKYQNYHQEVVLWNIDCKNRRSRVKEVIHYDDKGNVLDNYTCKNEEWENILVLTGPDSLRKILCVVQEKPSKKNK